MRRTPLWVFGLLLILIVGLGVYAYLTTPLPFGLSSVIRTPGGAAAPSPTPPTGPPLGARTGAGQTLVLGATNVIVQGVQRNQDLSANNRGGPPGSFTVVLVEIQNSGSESLSPQPTDFKLYDDRGRSYAVDVEATRSVNTTARRRLPFESTVPPGGTMDTLLAFETAPEANPLSLRVTLGYGDVELPR